MRKILPVLLFVVVMAAACGNNPNDESKNIESISISPSELTLNIGDSYSLSASHKPSGLPSPEYQWTSVNPNVVYVDNGIVTALQKGMTVITARAGENIQATCNIIVLPDDDPGITGDDPVSGVTLNHTQYSLNTGEVLQLKATVLPATAGNKGVTWRSTASSVAEVGPNGLVIAKSTGSTVIIVTTSEGEYSATCNVTVTAGSDTDQKVTGVTLKTIPALIREDRHQLEAVVSPSNAKNKTVFWSSDDDNIASVSSTGLVTANAVGTTVIHVTTADGGFTAQGSVKVSAKSTDVTGVRLNVTSKTLNETQTLELTATTTPANKGVKWHSTNPTVASVSSAVGVGKVNVKALNPGSTDIVVTTDEGGFTATCQITVDHILDADLAKMLPLAFIHGPGVVWTQLTYRYNGTLYSKIVNNTTEPLTLVSVAAYDRQTGAMANSASLSTDILTAGDFRSIGLALDNVYLPIVKWTLYYKGKMYVLQHQLTGFGA